MFFTREMFVRKNFGWNIFRRKKIQLEIRQLLDAQVNYKKSPLRIPDSIPKFIKANWNCCASLPLPLKFWRRKCFECQNRVWRQNIFCNAHPPWTNPATQWQGEWNAPQKSASKPGISYIVLKFSAVGHHVASVRPCEHAVDIACMNVQMQRVPVNACINIMLSYTKVYMQRVYMNVCINCLNWIAHGWHVRQSVQPITSKKLESSRVRHHVASRPCEPATDICWRALWLWPWSWNFVW